MNKFTIADVVRVSADAEPATLKQGFHELMLDKIRDQLEAKRDQIMDQYYNNGDGGSEDDEGDDYNTDDDNGDDGEEDGDDEDDDDGEDDDEEELEEGAMQNRAEKMRNGLGQKVANPVQSFERDPKFNVPRAMRQRARIAKAASGEKRYLSGKGK